jgi:5'-3' exonuclease
MGCVIKTLLVDGNNLLQIGFHGAKDLFHKGEHIGGIYHFLNTLRKFIDEHNFDKVVVFWDSENSTSQRKVIYPQYKQKSPNISEDFKMLSFEKQRQRIKQYLEEIFVRQIDLENNEADDLIAYYTQIATNENIMIFSGDRDLTQLISNNVSVYSPNTKRVYKQGDKIKFKDIEIPHYNVGTYKILAGDKSDNIDGIYYLGEKTLIKLFPEILENDVSINDILTKAEELFQKDKNNTAIKNLLTGKTRTGIYGDEFFQVNETIISLKNPLLTDEAKKLVETYYLESLDPNDRGYKNLMKMMMEDGLFKYLPKQDDTWINFLKPFLKLTRKEKRKHNQKN